VIWALADVAERDLALVAVGQAVTVRPRSYRDRPFIGKVTTIYPHLRAETRTARVRVELPNPDEVLRPDMYADIEIATGTDAPVVTVSESAVIDSGSRQIVLVDKGEGRFEPRDVKLGRRGGGRIEIKEGLEENSRVVVSANFLIDAESNLKAALSGMDKGEQPQ
jgi:Cu(I)/Ag(I) efflux system membrane fusion protein